VVQEFCHRALAAAGTGVRDVTVRTVDHLTVSSQARSEIRKGAGTGGESSRGRDLKRTIRPIPDVVEYCASAGDAYPTASKSLSRWCSAADAIGICGDLVAVRYGGVADMQGSGDASGIVGLVVVHIGFDRDRRHGGVGRVLLNEKICRFHLICGRRPAPAPCLHPHANPRNAAARRPTADFDTEPILIQRTARRWGQVVIDRIGSPVGHHELTIDADSDGGLITGERDESGPTPAHELIKDTIETIVLSC